MKRRTEQDDPALPPDELERRLRYLQKMGHITRRLERERDLGRLLDAIAEASLELTMAERAFVLLAAGGRTIDFQLARDRDGRSIECPDRAVSRTILDRVIASGDPCASIDPPHEPALLDAESVQDLKFVMCLPLRGPREEILGALYLDSRDGRCALQPWDLELVTAFVDQAAMAAARALEIGRLTDEVHRLQRRLEGRIGFEDIVGESLAIQTAVLAAERIARTEAPVLLEGETGTGKELFARAIHSTSSRAGGPLVSLNCGSLPEGLVESELFGHSAGAFTGAVADRRGLFEEADRGTLFLDEIEVLPQSIQPKILRVLDSGEIRRVGETASRHVDVRILAATNVDLARLAEEGRFRFDLVYRLKVLHLVLPALRHRMEDLGVLVQHFLARFNAEFGREVHGLRPWARKALQAHPFPGNIRELANILRHAVLFSRDDEIWLEDLPPEVQRSAEDEGVQEVQTFAELAARKREIADRMEREFLVRLLAATGGNVSEAARRSGLHRVQLHRLVRRHGLDIDRFRASTDPDPGGG